MLVVSFALVAALGVVGAFVGFLVSRGGHSASPHAATIGTASNPPTTAPVGPLTVASALKETQDRPTDRKSWDDLSTAYQQSGRTDLAIGALVRYTRLAPGDPDGLRRLAAAYIEIARQKADAARSVGSSSAEAAGSRAESQLALRNAIAAYQRLAMLNADDASVQFELATTAEQANDTMVAVNAYERFLELAPDDPLAPLVRQELKRLRSPPKRAHPVPSKAVPGKGAAIAYTRRIDALLTDSAQTRSDLGKLIGHFQSGDITASQAQAQIQSIIMQRQGLQASVADVAAPSIFAYPAQLLRTSIAAALADDTEVQAWIDAVAQGDDSAAKTTWARHLGTTAAATTAKEAFVAAYNRARARLGLGPFAIGGRY